VPRNMTQAAGMYNTLLCSDEPGLIVEVLNAYRLYERLPENLGEFTIPVGVVEVVREGTDLTIVTYGAMVNIALKAAEVLAQAKVDVEVIDVRSLLPFDRHGQILESLKKTNRIIFLDEDIPGGASAYMMQQVIEKQGGFYWLDTEPRTLTAQEHRPAYGSDGSYFSKPSVEDIVETAYDLMNESDPGTYPAI
jgi:2-oxoisovalerate dehydrogenase E1 component